MVGYPIASSRHWLCRRDVFGREAMPLMLSGLLNNTHGGWQSAGGGIEIQHEHVRTCRCFQAPGCIDTTRARDHKHVLCAMQKREEETQFQAHLLRDPFASGRRPTTDKKTRV